LAQKAPLFNRKDLIAYFLIAGAGAIVQLVCGGLLKDWFKLKYESTILPAYFISVILGFTLTKLFAFDVRKTQQTKREMFKFLMVATFSGFVTWFFSVLPYTFIQTFMRDFYFQIPFAYKKINVTQITTTTIGMGFSFISNYVLHKSFTFKSSGFYDKFKDLIK
jgi:putative flippase GtrA